MLLIHGYGEHSGRYERFGAWFGSHGFAVHAFDQRGHGRSDGIRCHVRRFAEFLDDVTLLLTRVRAEHPGLPGYLVGHSMGGLVAAAYVRERRPDLSGLVISGVPLRIADTIPPLRVRALRCLRRVAPRLRLDSGIDPDHLCTDPEVVRAYRDDPLVERRLTASLAIEFIDASERTAAGAGDIGLPSLVLHGSEDLLCSAHKSAAFAQAIPQARFKLYAQMRHEIFNEPDCERVYRDVLEWTREVERAGQGA
jgi:acylglycerol lipase